MKIISVPSPSTCRKKLTKVMMLNEKFIFLREKFATSSVDFVWKFSKIFPSSDGSMSTFSWDFPLAFIWKTSMDVVDLMKVLCETAIMSREGVSWEIVSNENEKILKISDAKFETFETNEWTRLYRRFSADSDSTFLRKFISYQYKFQKYTKLTTLITRISFRRYGENGRKTLRNFSCRTWKWIHFTSAQNASSVTNW